MQPEVQLSYSYRDTYQRVGTGPPKKNNELDCTQAEKNRRRFQTSTVVDVAKPCTEEDSYRRKNGKRSGGRHVDSSRVQLEEDGGKNGLEDSVYKAKARPVTIE